MSIVGGISSVDRAGVLARGYMPRGDAAVSAPSLRGNSVNAADLKIPNAGGGLRALRDEFVPTFTDTPRFQDIAPILNTLPQPHMPDVEAEEAVVDDDPVVDERLLGVNEDDDEAEDIDEEEVVELADERDPNELTDDERRIVADLQQRDREVRAHEQAHISVGGAYIRGGASYEYERGPDDKRYAVGGEVSIDTSPVRDNPEATIAKMQIVRAAALAPADPSAQDRAVAAAASREEASAGVELRERRAAENEEAASQRNQDVDDQDTNTAQQSSRMLNDIMAAYTNTNTPNTGGINFAA